MKVFVLPGTYDLLNLGDLAMLEVALERLRDLWPGCELHVLTHNPEDLLRHCPGVRPVLLKGRNRWLKMRSLPRGVFGRVPPERRKQFPLTLANFWRLGILAWPGQFRMVKPFVAGLFNADLVLMTGCGVIADPFSFNALRILDMFRVAIRCGIPAAMMGQGIGPLETPGLVPACGEVLPRLGLLGIRERLHTPRWLRLAGVGEANVRVTGDDAVETASRARTGLGDKLGVNLRLAGYSRLGESVVAVVREVVESSLDEMASGAVGLPVLSGSAPNGDNATLAKIFPGRPEVVQAAAEVRTTAQLAARVAECRLVIAGSYHAGVFALAQGIPVVAIAESPYYREKFTGLCAQFGEGCLVLDPQHADFKERLASAVRKLWAASPALRPALYDSAMLQVRAGRAAYAELKRVAEPAGGD